MWVFIEKNTETNEIIRIALYGSIRAISNCEKIVIGNLAKSENGLRYLLKKGGDKYIDKRYTIEKKTVLRNTNTPF